MRIRIRRFILITAILIIPSYYLLSMYTRGLDIRKDSILGEAIADIPFKYNPSRNLAVTQSISIKNGKLVHYVYIFKFHGVFYNKKLIFSFKGDATCGDYNSENVNSWINWHGDSKLKININSNTLQKVLIKEENYDNVQIDYSYYFESCNRM
ncbi:Uncharacterised protein [Moraxella veridica]|nr:Uncharacterised protein [Moraxella catarrhalis]